MPTQTPTLHRRFGDRDSPRSSTMAEDGEEKLLAVARHIAQTIGRGNNTTDDILHIFSSFDRRFSAESLALHAGARDSPSRLPNTLASLDRRMSTFVSCPSHMWSESFLKAVDDLIALLRDLDDTAGVDQDVVDRANGLLQRSMLRLEDEFTKLIHQDTSAVSTEASDEEEEAILFASPVTDSDGVPVADEEEIPVAIPATIDPLSQAAVANLYQIARRMVRGGYGKICAAAYARARAGSLERTLARSGAGEWQLGELREKPWPALDAEIRRWIHAAKAAFRAVFPSERRLARWVFADLTHLAELSFSYLCRDRALQLLALPRVAAELSRSPERLFRVVDLYEALRDLLPGIEELFPGKHSSPVLSEASACHAMLRTAIQTMFAELEDLTRRDPAKEPFPGAGVHPITRYVMNYLGAALGSLPTLTEVMQDALPGPGRPSCTSLKEQIVWIMEILQGNIEAKSKLYRDRSQSCVFLMNNVQYMIRKVRGTELEEIMGVGWIRRQMATVQQLHNAYGRNTWGALVGQLLDGGERIVTQRMAKEKLRRFAAGFEEVWRAQRGWTVVDEQLRTEMRIAAGACVVPAYRGFLGKNPALERSAKYSVEDVESRINDLYQGR